MASACPSCHADLRRIAAGWYVCEPCGMEFIDPHAGPEAAAAFSRQVEEMFREEIEYKRDISKKKFGGVKKSGRTRKKDAKRPQWVETERAVRQHNAVLRRKAK